MFNYIYSFTTDINKHYRVLKSCVQNQVYAQIFLGFKPPKGKKCRLAFGRRIGGALTPPPSPSK
jgi:hypothetical protein